MTKTAALSSIAALFWLTVAGLVINYQFIASGRLTLRWPNPTQPNASFRWADRPAVRNGQITLASGEGATVHVAVPRPFSSGQLLVRVLMNQGGTLRLKASTLPGRPAAATTIRDSFGGSLEVHWQDLATRGRQFDVRLTNEGLSDVTIQRLMLSITR